LNVVRYLMTVGAKLTEIPLLFVRKKAAFSAENLFLRRQLAMYAERGQRPRHALVLLGKLFDWRSALVVVTPRTFIAWQRDLVRLLWSWKSRTTGRPPLPIDVRRLIATMADENPSWSPRRIASELRLKLGVRLSAQTVRRYLPNDDPRKKRRGMPRGDQKWAAFVRNHAKAILACDFAVSMTIGLRILYIFVVMEIGSRRILHTGVTEHPTAEWTTQQLRCAIPADATYEYLLHDRDAIFSSELDAAVQRLGVEVLKSPPRSPKANAYCERLIGTLRRECLDWIIPLTERQLRSVVREWASHYNTARPHMSLGPGFPTRPKESRCRPAPRVTTCRTARSHLPRHPRLAASRIPSRRSCLATRSHQQFARVARRSRRGCVHSLIRTSACISWSGDPFGYAKRSCQFSPSVRG
jgi:putative transposase